MTSFMSWKQQLPTQATLRGQTVGPNRRRKDSVPSHAQQSRSPEHTWRESLDRKGKEGKEKKNIYEATEKAA